VLIPLVNVFFFKGNSELDGLVCPIKKQLSAIVADEGNLEAKKVTLKTY